MTAPIEAFSRLARVEAGVLHSAEDAVQDVYLNMYRRWATISAQEGSLTADGRIAGLRT
ncbi:hypothetical protein [Streptomyces brasiliensis]|uniref:Uncharacterized protein n=1 Tax=Streptomyces brasiliensis TaxID=1954 RepID=A0A917P4V9_9ACTN|nr:hypothetical protein [Streptomyces brasiliensis]GGJ61891.1 hypothetical protein GCM10010121_085620 [Streptomyces brasiliensis]